MKNRLKRVFCFLIFCLFMDLYPETVSIKTYYTLTSFGTKTKELKNSVILNYDENEFLVDSSVYSHDISLSEKYVYVVGANEGLKLKREFGKERVLSYQFENDSLGRRIETTLVGPKDSIYWKEYIKYDSNGNRVKRIRYNPEEALNPKMVPSEKKYGALIWGEIYDYDSTGQILEKKEIYDNYILEITRFKIDSLNQTKKIDEYFDPSVIVRTIYYHDENNRLLKEISVGKYGNSIGSKTYEYDILDRKVKITTYDNNGLMEETIKFVYDNKNSKTYKSYVDSSLEIFLKKETLFNGEGNPYIEAIIDGKDRVLEKNVFFYDTLGRTSQVKQYDMFRHNEFDNVQLPIKVNIYEY